jgi:hypothetical protein
MKSNFRFMVKKYEEKMMNRMHMDSDEEDKRRYGDDEDELDPNTVLMM